MALDQEFDLDELARKKSPDKEMSFLDHLEELRWHIIRSLIVVAVFMVLGFVYPHILFDQIIFGPKRLDFWTYEALKELSYVLYHDDRLAVKEFNFQITNITMSGQFTSHMLISFVAGIIAAFPYILWEVWRFIRPALSEKERRKSTGIVLYGSLLFLSGILFGYYFLAPVSVNFMGGYTISKEIVNYISLQSYISFVTMLTFGSGLMFELPMLVYFLARLGLLTSAFMKKYRRYAFLIILIISAVVTPPDVASQILMTIPIYGLFELSIVIASRVEKNKN